MGSHEFPKNSLYFKFGFYHFLHAWIRERGSASLSWVLRILEFQNRDAPSKNPWQSSHSFNLCFRAGFGRRAMSVRSERFLKF
jgi:hypothetical protein